MLLLCVVVVIWLLSRNAYGMDGTRWLAEPLHVKLVRSLSGDARGNGWNWSCEAIILVSVELNALSGRGPCPFPFPRWHGKHGQWDCEIHEGSD